MSFSKQISMILCLALMGVNAASAQATRDELVNELLSGARAEARVARQARICDQQARDIGALLQAHRRARADVVREALETKLVEVRGALRDCAARAQGLPPSQTTNHAAEALAQARGAGTAPLGELRAVSGPAFDETHLLRALANNRARFERCREAIARSAPESSGTVHVIFTLNPDGRTSDVSTSARVHSMPDDAGRSLTQCLRQAVRQTRANVGPRAPVRYQYRVEYTRSRRPPASR